MTITTRVSDERLDELIVHGQKESGQKVTGLHDVVAALRELRESRALLKECEAYMRHHSHCGKCKQMPMQISVTYFAPPDFDAWRDSQDCTCGLNELMARMRGEG